MCMQKGKGGGIGHPGAGGEGGGGGGGVVWCGRQVCVQVWVCVYKPRQKWQRQKGKGKRLTWHAYELQWWKICVHMPPVTGQSLNKV